MYRPALLAALAVVAVAGVDAAPLKVDNIKKEFQRDRDLFEGKVYPALGAYKDMSYSQAAVTELENAKNGKPRPSGKNLKLAAKEAELRMARDLQCQGVEKKEDSVKCFLEVLAQKYPSQIFTPSVMYNHNGKQKQNHINSLQDKFMDRDFNFEFSKWPAVAELRRKYEQRSDEVERLEAVVKALMRVYGTGEVEGEEDNKIKLSKSELDAEIKKEKKEGAEIKKVYNTARNGISKEEKEFLDILLQSVGESGLKSTSIDALITKFLVERKMRDLDASEDAAQLAKLKEYVEFLDTVPKEQKSKTEFQSESSSDSSAYDDSSDSEGSVFGPVMTILVIVLILGGAAGFSFYVHRSGKDKKRG